MDVSRGERLGWGIVFASFGGVAGLEGAVSGFLIGVILAPDITDFLEKP